MAELLVSVRSAAEAEATVAGGVGLIDVKEPAHGPLGRAPEQTVAAVVRVVAGRRPVSAALGEFLQGEGTWHRKPLVGWPGLSLRSPGLPRRGFEDSAPATPAPLDGLSYVKWGLSGCGENPAWAAALGEACTVVEHTSPGCRLVAVAYADWRQAKSPHPDRVAAFARERRMAGLLLDTWTKDGRTLLDWLPAAEVARLCESCRDAGVRVALAGSLGPGEILRLKEAQPDWFAVRGAVCRNGRRSEALDRHRLEALVGLVRGFD